MRARTQLGPCNAQGCDEPKESKGLCSVHYFRWRRTGNPLGAQRKSFEERFWQRVDKSGECWLWTGGIDRYGYGKTYQGKVTIKAHRAAYELLIGKIPDGLTLDHLCRVRSCVNPAHLEPVTQGENIRRAWAVRGGGAFNRTNAGTRHVHLKTHCINGHQFTPENTKVRPNGSRKCRACDRDHATRAYARKKGLVA